MSSPPWQALGLQLLERDWLSANHIVFAAHGATPSTLIDSGYARHAPMTLALVQHALEGQLPSRLVNTHLHSDHCGGNAFLQQAAREQGLPVADAAANAVVEPKVAAADCTQTGLFTFVPAPAFDAARTWNQRRLSYRPTGQTCPRFEVHAGLGEGDWLELGPTSWQVLAAPGHDPDALMLWEPQTRCLIAGDALWEQRLAIIFPELEDLPGFAATRATLDRIEALAPRWVIPGHGPAFEDVGRALAASRARLQAFEREPLRHTRHAARALAMFHLMEEERIAWVEFHRWLQQTPLFQAMARQLGETNPAEWARQLLQALEAEGLMQVQADENSASDDLADRRICSLNPTDSR